MYSAVYMNLLQTPIILSTFQLTNRFQWGCCSIKTFRPNCNWSTFQL